MSLDTLWTQIQNARYTICQLSTYKRPSELAFLFQNVLPQGLHPGSGDYIFINSCSIICIDIISLFFNNQLGFKKKPTKNRQYICAITAFPNEVSLLHTKFSIFCCGFCFLTKNIAKKRA